jgi:predicted O-linked N-acetylglucosamine transferase (SPINDLY family)
VAVRAGIDPGRLIFGGALPLPEYLARYRSMDLFLDTLPQNAGATASDALWAGLPVVTRMGEAFAGRMAASVLTSINLPELVASSQEQYETLAVELALDPRRLAKIKRALEERRSSALLFDIGRFARHLEAGYLTIYQRHQAGLPPADLHAEAGR